MDPSANKWLQGDIFDFSTLAMTFFFIGLSSLVKANFYFPYDKFNPIWRHSQAETEFPCPKSF